METFPTKALDQFPCPTWSIVSGSSFKEGRGKQLVRADPRPRVERVNAETIRSGSLHPHDLTLENSDKPYVCFGCKEDGSGERFRCGRPECRYDGPQYHKFCALPENNRNHRYISGCCFNLVVRDGSSQCVDLYCAACSKDIEGFFFSCSRGGQENNLHPWCMYLEPSLQVKNIRVLLVRKISKTCIECGSGALMRNRTDSRGKVVPEKMETWGYQTQDRQDIIHIHCMKARLREFWRSKMTEDDLIARKVFAKDNSRGFLKGLVERLSDVMFGAVKFFFSPPIHGTVLALLSP